MNSLGRFFEGAETRFAFDHLGAEWQAFHYNTHDSHPTIRQDVRVNSQSSASIIRSTASPVWLIGAEVTDRVASDGHVALPTLAYLLSRAQPAQVALRSTP